MLLLKCLSVAVTGERWLELSLELSLAKNKMSKSLDDMSSDISATKVRWILWLLLLCAGYFTVGYLDYILRRNSCFVVSSKKHCRNY